MDPSEAPSADTPLGADRLFEFLSSEQHEGMWDSLREVSAGLLSGLAWPPSYEQGLEAFLATAMDCETALSATRDLRSNVGPHEWAGCCEDPQEETDDHTPSEEDTDDFAGGESSKCTSDYRGVSRRYGRWKARIKHNGHDIAIGLFEDEMSAARAYDRKARQFYGDHAQLNFPTNSR